MCQILGMNCAQKTDFMLSFSGFRLRGGLLDKHSDGWGLSIYEGRGLRTFTDTLPAAESPLAEMVANYPIKTLNMMSHIRYATQGHAGELANVHPFQRELWGIQFCFCHNGDVQKFGCGTVGDDSGEQKERENPLLGMTRREDRVFHPVGDTDSEALFCAILNALRAEYDAPPTLPELYLTVQKLCDEVIQGEEDTAILNFLLGCGEYTLLAYSWPGSRPNSDVWNGLSYTIRKPPFTTVALADIDCKVDFSSVTTSADRVAVITTKPLTINEKWIEMKRGELLMFDRGLPYFHASDCETVEKQGRGLTSNAKYRYRYSSSNRSGSSKDVCGNSISNSSDSRTRSSSSNSSNSAGSIDIGNSIGSSSCSSTRRRRRRSDASDLSGAISTSGASIDSIMVPREVCTLKNTKLTSASSERVNQFMNAVLPSH